MQINFLAHEWRIFFLTFSEFLIQYLHLQSALMFQIQETLKSLLNFCAKKFLLISKIPIFFQNLLLIISTSEKHFFSIKHRWLYVKEIYMSFKYLSSLKQDTHSLEKKEKLFLQLTTIPFGYIPSLHFYHVHHTQKMNENK